MRSTSTQVTDLEATDWPAEEYQYHVSGDGGDDDADSRVAGPSPLAKGDGLDLDYISSDGEEEIVGGIAGATSLRDE